MSVSILSAWRWMDSRLLFDRHLEEEEEEEVARKASQKVTLLRRLSHACTS